MNKIDFTQQGGFPFDQDVLAFLQDSILTSANTAFLGGQTYVLHGCTENGGNVDNGIVVIAGEILPFVGGAAQAKVVVIENTENMTYEDGAIHPSIKKRHATFGDDGVTDLLWANFKKNTTEGVLARLDRLEKVAAPFLAVKDGDGTEHRGGMVLWKKPANLIPAGWQEVVDWRGRLPMGYDPADPAFDTVGKTGGTKSKVIANANLPVVSPWSLSDFGHSHVIYGETMQKDGTIDKNNKVLDTGGDVNHGNYQESTSTAYSNISQNQNVGGGQALDLLNPYRIVMFIECIVN